MTRFAGVRAVLFDLDGTLVDSVADLAAAFDALLAERGRGPIGLARARGLMGNGPARFVENGFAATGGLPAPLAELVPRFLALYEGRIAAETRPFPGAVETLARLAAAGLALGVVTNKPDRPTRLLLEELDLARYFSAVVGGDGRRKPDPEPVHRALAALRARAGDALLVGDSAVDVAAARASALPVAVVSFGYTETPAAELGADAVLASFAELETLLGI